MEQIRVHLFGKPLVQRVDHGAADLHSGKAQELFCFLLLNRNRTHTRESLATLLWPEAGSSVSRKYLRQAIWQLHMGLGKTGSGAAERILVGEDHGVRLDSDCRFWLDVEVFERAWCAVQGCSGELLDSEQSEALVEAVGIYRGDLLEGWYFDWCLCERERLQTIFLTMLDKLMGHAEIAQEFEKGLAYGEQILRYDRARERTYQRMMRLQCLSGDRAGGLRQFQRCSVALDEELGVRPSKPTLEIYEQIKCDRLAISRRPSVPVASPTQVDNEQADGSILNPMTRLKNIRSLLGNLQNRVQEELRAIDQVLRAKSSESLDVKIVDSRGKQEQV